MKIAIMTQPLGHNYGGLIQAWALQQVLKKTGHEPVTIDRRADVKSSAYRTVRLCYRLLQNTLGKRQGPINFERHLPYILQNTHAFIDQHLCMSERLDSTAWLKAHFEREQYDAVIVGSDQTWRPAYSPNIDNFFLDFLSDNNIKRIAYASSFGVDEWEFTKEQTQRFALMAKQFDAISVRESSGVDLCRKYLGVEANHVLDPTLLLTKQAYEALYKTKGILEKKGIYTYILDHDEWKCKVIETARNKLNIPVYSNQPKVSISALSSHSLYDYMLPSLESWLKGFSDANFVITDSFHGTVFSIIFNKPFISLINPGRGASRFYSLCDKLGLRNRLLAELDEQEIEKIISSTLNYSEVEKKLNTLRRNSKRFLEQGLIL